MNDPYLLKMLGDKETVLLVTRQHWFKLIRYIFVEIVFTIFTILAVLYILVSNLTPLAPLGFLLLIIPLFSATKDVLIYANHKYIVTNRRVIQIFGVMNKNVTDSSLEKVNDVKLEQSYWGRLFNFGDVEILTASELGVNRFTFIANPVGFKTTMLNAKVQLEGAMIAPTVVERQPASAPDLIAQLDNLRKEGILTEEEFQQKKADLLKRM